MTKITTQFAAIVAATVMTLATQGTMLWQFDKLAHQETPSAVAPTKVTLETVTVTARRA